MSQNPYAQMGQPVGRPPEPMGHGSGGGGAGGGPAKTSVMAVIALVLSLIVCLPLGPLGVILGLIAFVMIGGSQGRTKGRGLAVAAIIIGLITSVAWIGVVGGGIKMALAQRTQVQEPMYDALRKLEAGDTAPFRAMLAPALASNIKDEEIIAFRDAYLQTCGAFQGEPTDMKSGFAIAGVAGDIALMQRVQTPTGKQPMPIGAVFANGAGGIVVVSDTVANGFDFVLSSPKFQGTVVNVAVAIPGSSPAVLTDFIGAPAGTPGTNATPAPATQEGKPAEAPEKSTGG